MRAFLFLMLAACTHEIDAYEPLPLQPARDLDILFVLDDSANRGNYTELTAQVDDLQARLASVDGQLPSLHIGLVTTDLGTSGTLDAIPIDPVSGCSGDGKGGRLQMFGTKTTSGYFEDLRAADGSRKRNFISGDLAAEIASLTSPPATVAGCEYEQPLEAMRRALDPATNPGFIRPGAMLAVVFLTNEDDCSLQRGLLLDPNYPQLGPMSYRCTSQGVVCDGDDPSRPGEHTNCRPRADSAFIVDVGEYKAFLDAYKPDRRDVIVSAVAGPRTPYTVRDAGIPVLGASCQGASGSAVPAVRIGALVDSFGGSVVDGCAQTAAYQQIMTPIVNRQKSCFPTLARGADESCTVVEVAGETELELDRCAEGSTGMCWYSYADATACPDGDNLGIAIKGGANAPQAGSRIEARCFAN